MGNAESTAQAISNTVNKSTTSVLMANSSQCGQNNSGLQSVDFSNIKAGDGCSLEINSSQKFSQIPSFSCLSNASQSGDLQSQLSAALSAAVKSETSGLSGALNSSSNSETISNIVNDISTNVNISNTASCLQNNLANQQAVFQAIQSSCPRICRQEIDPSKFNDKFTLKDLDVLCTTNIGNEQELLQAATAACTSENTALTEVINKAAAEVSQMATAENTGVDVGDIISSITGPFMYSIIAAVVCLLIVCVGIVVFLMSAGGQSAVSTLSNAAAEKINSS